MCVGGRLTNAYFPSLRLNRRKKKKMLMSMPMSIDELQMGESR